MHSELNYNSIFTRLKIEIYELLTFLGNDRVTPNRTVTRKTMTCSKTPTSITIITLILPARCGEATTPQLSRAPTLETPPTSPEIGNPRGPSCQPSQPIRPQTNQPQHIRIIHSKITQTLNTMMMIKMTAMII